MNGTCIKGLPHKPYLRYPDAKCICIACRAPQSLPDAACKHLETAYDQTTSTYLCKCGVRLECENAS
jgi:hypothetical protein